MARATTRASDGLLASCRVGRPATRTTTPSGDFGYFEDGGYWLDANPYDQTWTGPIGSGSWRIKVEAISTSTGTVIKAAQTNIYYLTIT